MIFSLPFNLSFAFDLLIIVLLIVTILYSMKLSKLSKMFQRIQNDRQEIEKLLQQLSNIIDKADNAIQNMKVTATEDGARLQKNIDDAETIADELEIMLNSGNNLAGRLQELVEQSGKIRKKTEAESKSTKNKKDTGKEKMLLNAIGNKKGGKK